MQDAHTREEVLDLLIDVGRRVDKRGLISASGGNLSGRVPGADSFFVTGTGTWLGELKAEDFTEMNLAGEVIGGNPHPSSEHKLHLRTYQVRKDINSIVHLHPQVTVLVDALGEKVRPLTLDHAGYLGKINRIDFYPNASDELADEAAKASRDSNVIILAHHGCSCLGDSISMAYRRALNLEEAALASYRSCLAGQPMLCFPVEHTPPEAKLV